MIKDDASFIKWRFEEASPDETALWERVEDFGELFEDMCFQPGTKPYELTRCQAKGDDGNWFDASMPLPDEIEYFSYSWFRYKIEKQKGICGSFNHRNSVLTVEPDAEDSTVLHEMIHLHEFLINDQPLYMHDMLYWALYQDLKNKIPKLDEIITGHAHLLTGSSLFNKGGLHDILFLLKSFDLDIRMGYPLGTVFGYGRISDFKDYSYTKPDETNSD